VGRAAYQEPWRLLSVDPEIFDEPAHFAAMKDVFAAMMPYIERELAKGTRLARDQEGDANPEVAVARHDWATR
jgi:hypothetical protein